MKYAAFTLVTLIFFIVSCRKCQECYLEEPNSATGEVSTTSLGEICGDDLDNLKAGQYSTNPHARTYCK